MKILKFNESIVTLTAPAPKFKEGDIVYLEDKKYVIKKVIIEYFNYSEPYYKLKGISQQVSEYLLISELEYNTKKYNL